MDTPPDLVVELQAEGLTEKEAVAAATVLAGAAPPTSMFSGAIWRHELAELRARVDAGEATNDDARRLLEEVARLHQIIGWSVHDPGVRDALRAVHATRTKV